MPTFSDFFRENTSVLNSHGSEDTESKEALLNDQPNANEEDQLSAYTASPIYKGVSPFNVLGVLICVGCLAINWYLTTAYPTISPRDPYIDYLRVPRDQFSTLRRPSPFIGFDKISRPAHPTPRSFVNYPMSIGLVNSSSPKQTFDDDPMRLWTNTGLVSTEDRLVMMSNSVSTIIQFRAIDYGMERCELNLHISADDTLKLTAPLKVGIYLLDKSTGSLNMKTLSYATRPVRTSTIDTFLVFPNANTTWNQELKCAWDSILTFEIAFVGQGFSDFDGHSELSIQWWQNKEDSVPKKGVFVIQRETV